MKKISINISVLLFVFAALAIPGSGENTDQILFGFTNVSQALMLHPTMARFQIKEGRFSPAVSDENQSKDSSQRLKEFENSRNEILVEKKKFEDQMAKADKDLSISVSSLNVKYASKSKDSSPDTSSDEYNNEKNSLENKFWVQRQDLQAKLSEIDNKLLKLNQENELLHLTSQEETDRIFKVMLDDIFEAIDMVAKHYKVNFVFNTSFSVERTPVNPSFTPVNPMGEFFATKFNRDAEEVLYKHGSDGKAPLSMTLGYWIACQRWAFRNTIDPRLDKMILKGGLDMTPAVIDYVYQKYNVPSSHRDVIQEFLKKQAQ